MADSKITALTALTTADPATDMFPVVDVSDTTMAASGTTKRISINNILACSPTATLASATITGDLTVDTSTLKVDSANNRVGVRTASPAATLSVVGVAGTGNTVAGISGNTDSGLLSIGNDNSNGGAGTQTWTGSAQSYAAAISFGQVNTTGVREQIRTHATVFSTNIQSFGRADLVIATKGSLDNNDPTEKYRIASDGVATWSNVGGVAGTAMTLNANGLGIGVTPSAWTLKAVQIVNGGIYGSGNETGYYANAFYGSSGWRYINSAGASGYLQNGGSHQWYSSTSANVAGTDPAFTQAMTLDASGILMVGTTNTVVWNTTNEGCVVSPIAIQASRSGDSALLLNRIASDGKIAVFARQGIEVGNIAVTTLATTYNSISDYRLKEDAQPLSGGLARVNALKPSVYKWKANGSAGEGFLAHELAEVVPAAVTGEKDAVNEDGSIKAQSIDMSRVVPILVAAIQELTARVQTLEAK